MLIEISSSIVIGVAGLLLWRHADKKKKKENLQLELERRELIILVERIRHCWFSIIDYDIENPLYLRLHEMSRFLNALNEKELARMTELCYGEIISLRKIDNASKSAAFTNSSAALIELLGMVIDNLDEYKRICIENSSSEIVAELHIVKELNAKKNNELNIFNNVSASQPINISGMDLTPEIEQLVIDIFELTGAKNQNPYNFKEFFERAEKNARVIDYGTQKKKR